MTSATLGVFECSVVYVVMDNDQFFERVLLRHQIQVSHLIKVRQGYRSGGSNPCLSAVYPMMGNLGVRYLIADRQLHFCPHHHMRLLSVMQGPCEDFKVDVQGATFTWSGLGCRVYGVTRTREALTPDSLRYGLGLIAHNPDFEFVAEGTQARARDHAPRCQRQCPKNIELKSTSVIAIHE
jgi:hypothetical protein